MPNRYRVYYARQIPDLGAAPVTRASMGDTHVLVHELEAETLGGAGGRLHSIVSEGILYEHHW